MLLLGVLLRQLKLLVSPVVADTVVVAAVVNGVGSCGAVGASRVFDDGGLDARDGRDALDVR
eukprot:6515132-Alexandrium_andersonii.AAC.1